MCQCSAVFASQRYIKDVFAHPRKVTDERR
jgi:hypothetical protein